jgi:hypothetical protein
VAEHRHKRETNARRLSPFRARAVVIAAPLALLATASAVTLGVLGTTPEAPEFLTAEAPAADIVTEGPVAPREQSVSRGSSRLQAQDDEQQEKKKEPPTELERVLAPTATKKAVKSADTKLWTQAPLNLWTEPGDQAKKLGELEPGTKILVTGRSLLGREEVVVDGKPRWVTTGYLSEEEPFTLGGDCTNGTSVPSGVSESIVKVHAAVCAEFPEITVYGTLRGGGGDHGVGRAVDIMVSGDRGWQVADFVREYYADLGVSYIIYAQNIWSVERGGEGWRGMSDRGSVTANHYDHVHVSVF